MSKVVVYITTAILLGLAATLVPSWVFLSRVANDQSYAAKPASERVLPLLESHQPNHVELVSTRDVGALGAGFLVALTVYGVSKRRARHQDALG